MCAFKEEERSVLISVTLMKGITVYKITVPTIGITFCMKLKGPTMWQRLESKISFLCLFVSFFFFCHPHFSFFSCYLFYYLHFFPSALLYPHFPIRICHPQLSGPRLQTPAENSTHLLYLPIPSSAETWKIFGNRLCQFVSLKLTF